MRDREVFTIEKIPVRLSLYDLNSASCLTYAVRYYFSALGKHPMQHPLMHQIESNPDCQALAICADEVPIALCFFHLRTNDPENKSVILHNFMVAPYIRGRGIGGLLAIYFLDNLIDDNTRRIEVELDFPPIDREAGFASPVMQELMTHRSWLVAGDDLALLKSRMKQGEETLSRSILKSIITRPNFKERMQRKHISIGAVSNNNDFFERISGLDLPAYAAVQSIHTEFHKAVESRLDSFDLLILHDTVLKSQPNLLDNIGRMAPWLPVVVAGDGFQLDQPSVIVAKPMEELSQALIPHLEMYDPERAVLNGSVKKKNLLHLPEREVLSYYKNRHVGERIFIAASGPSLSDVDPDSLSNEIIITINDALLKFPSTKYAAVMDARKLHELHEYLLMVDALFTLKGNSYGVEIDLLGTEGFSLELENGIYSGYTTAFFCLQLVIFMGFKEICYLGLDLGNTLEKSHFFGSRPLQDQDRPDVYTRMRQSFERVADTVEQMGIKVYNCSPVSELKSFPFKTIEQIQQNPPRPQRAF